jgi:hypothetical protein
VNKFGKSLLNGWLALLFAVAVRGAEVSAPAKDNKVTNQPPFSAEAISAAFHAPTNWLEKIKLGMTGKELGLEGEGLKRRLKKVSGTELFSESYVSADPKFKSLTIQPKGSYWYFRWQGPRSNCHTTIILRGDRFDESVVIFSRLTEGSCFSP